MNKISTLLKIYVLCLFSLENNAVADCCVKCGATDKSVKFTSACVYFSSIRPYTTDQCEARTCGTQKVCMRKSAVCDDMILATIANCPAPAAGKFTQLRNFADLDLQGANPPAGGWQAMKNDCLSVNICPNGTKAVGKNCLTLSGITISAKLMRKCFACQGEKFEKCIKSRSEKSYAEKSNDASETQNCYEMGAAASLG
ncbi:MAG: hypothetical protein LBF28_02470 [Rickettsiales bacterium]|nr:hypothetical protein [Rickettsiales bacterium]